MQETNSTKGKSVNNYVNEFVDIVKTMNPNLRLKRTKTLMEGHDLCDHIFTWDQD